MTNSRNKINKVYAYTALVILLLQVGLIFVSWIVAAAFPELDMHSLLSGEGIRRMLGNSVDDIGSPLLVWILLVSIAVGALLRSGLWTSLCRMKNSDYRQRLALRFVAGELCVFVVIVLLLTTVPHAALLNVMGSLFPSSFTSGLVPILTNVVCIFSITYGVMVGRLHSVVEVFQILTTGIEAAAPLVVDYILLIELYHSVLFVFAI